MDLATLGFKIDTSDVKKAQDDLDGLNKEGKETQASAAAVGESWDEQTARLKAMVQQSSLAVQANAKFAESQRSIEERARQAADGLNAQNKAGTDWSKVQAEMNARGQVFNKSAKDAASAVGLQGAELERLMARVYPLQARLKALEEDEDRLSRAFKAGQLSAAQYADGIAEIGKRKDVLDDLNTKANTAANGMHKFSLESAGARRELGVMLGEIAQGNWGNLEGSLATLANRTGLFSAALSPVGLLVGGVGAAIGALAIAAVQGAEDEEKLNRALIATGNYAGVTAGQMRLMAEATISSPGQFGQAAAALQVLAASGKVTGDRLAEAAQASVDFAEITGKSIDEAAAAFVSLQDDPVKAIKALDEQYHVLTLAQYETIKALQDQGDAELAAAEAQTAASQALAERAAEVRKSQGLITRGWDEIRDAAKAAWDAMNRVGQSTSNSEDLAAANAKLQNYKNYLPSTKNLTDQQLLAAAQNPSDPNHSYFANSVGDIRQLIAQKEQASAGSQWETYVAQTEADNQAIQTQAKKASEVMDGYLKSAKSDHDKADEIAKVKAATAALIKADPSGKAGYESDQAAAIKQINKKYTDSSASALDNAQLQASVQKYKDMLTAANTAFDSYQKNLDTQYKAGLISADEYYGKMKESVTTSSETQVAEINAEIAVLQKFRGTQQQNVAAQQKIGELQTQAADVQAKANAQMVQLGIQETAEVQKKKAAYDALTASLQKQLDVENQRIKTQLDSVGMGSKEIEQQSALTEIEQRRTDQLQKYSDELGKKQIDPEAYASSVQQVNTYFNQMRDNQIAGYAKMDEAQADWRKGVTKGWDDFRDQALDVSSQTASAVGDAFSTFTDDMVTALNTGKLSFHSFTVSVLEDIEKIALHLAEEKGVSAILGSFGIGGSGSAGAGTADYAGSFSALGNVFSGGDISKYSGSIVSSPTMFSGKHLTAFANGGNVMGEAGPEAILPLRRGSDGKLGVQLAGNSKDGGSNVNFTQTINIASDGSASTTEQATGDQSAYAKAFSDRMKQISLQTIAQEQRPGGLLWKSRMNK